MGFTQVCGVIHYLLCYLGVLNSFMFTNFPRKLSATPEGRDKITNKFKLCKNLTKPEDMDELNGEFEIKIIK